MYTYIPPTMDGFPGQELVCTASLGTAGRYTWQPDPPSPLAADLRLLLKIMAVLVIAYVIYHTFYGRPGASDSALPVNYYP